MTKRSNGTTSVPRPLSAAWAEVLGPSKGAFIVTHFTDGKLTQSSLESFRRRGSADPARAAALTTLADASLPDSALCARS